MSKRLILVAIVLVFCAGCIFVSKHTTETPGAAVPISGEITGRELLAKLDSADVKERDYAYGYIAGVYGALADPQGVPDSKTEEKLAGIVSSGLRARPSELDRPAISLLREIFGKDLPATAR